MATSRAEGASTSAPPGEDRGEEFLRSVASSTHELDDPVEKLRQLRGTINRYRKADAVLRAVPVPGLRQQAYRWLKLDAVEFLFRPHSLSRTAPPPEAARPSTPLLIAAVVVAVLGTIATLRLSRQRSESVGAATPAAPTAHTRPAPSVAENLPPTPAAIEPRTVWLVERGTGFEQYSNGLRIETAFVTKGDPRRFRLFTRAGLASGVFTKPVGILYHTSESDIWPLDASYNENLRKSSTNLLRYISRNRLYNFVIDRFGRVYRIVREADRANHAGNSIWSHGDFTFLSLNNAFIGICFETRWEGGRALPITQAQLASGRVLTDFMRQVHEIAPEMCVTHGLTSVNPKKHLIGHHVDWARGFPFEAFGLPNQYLKADPAVSQFGFAYDDEFMKKMDGEPWPGVLEAERLLQAEAQQAGQTVEELRRSKRALYDRWIEQQKDDNEGQAVNAPAPERQPRTAGAGVL